MCDPWMTSLDILGCNYVSTRQNLNVTPLQSNTKANLTYPEEWVQRRLLRPIFLPLCKRCYQSLSRETQEYPRILMIFKFNAHLDTVHQQYFFWYVERTQSRKHLIASTLGGWQLGREAHGQSLLIL